MKLFNQIILLILLINLLALVGISQNEKLSFPGLLKKKEMEAGNPLATYAAMLELDEEYKKSKIFAKIYPEIRLTFEEFLGVPSAGLKAMQLPQFRRAGINTKETSIPKSFRAKKAIDIIEQKARATQIVIWAEEHHLPQTRSLYEQLLKRLKKQGYRYLAAETFSKNVMQSNFKVPNYNSGYYTRDPVFASAVRTAVKLGYKLIAYETNEQGPADDISFRDRKQATNIKKLIFDQDSTAKVLVLVGRAHASEKVASNGWTPMAYTLKKTTKIDPFTVWAPTMNQRLEIKDEHPLYRFATSKKLVKVPTIFINKATNKTLGPGFCDAYVFFPRVKFINNRPNWMIRELKRKKVKIPQSLLTGYEMRLVQAFKQNESASVIPIDQVLINNGEKRVLMLPKGKFWLRAIDKDSKILGREIVNVR